MIDESARRGLWKEGLLLPGKLRVSSDRGIQIREGTETWHGEQQKNWAMPLSTIMRRMYLEWELTISPSISFLMIRDEKWNENPAQKKLREIETTTLNEQPRSSHGNCESQVVVFLW
jgi:hypothetical protein